MVMTGSLFPHCLLDVGEPAPQAAPFEVMETEVAIKAGSVVVYCIDNHRPGTELLSTAGTAAQGVDEQVATKLVAVLGAVQRQTGEDDYGYRVGHAMSQP